MSSSRLLLRRVFHSVAAGKSNSPPLMAFASLAILTAAAAAVNTTGGFSGMKRDTTLLTDCDSSNNRNNNNDEKNVEYNTAPIRAARLLRKKTALQVAAASSKTTNSTSSTTTTTRKNSQNNINNTDGSTRSGSGGISILRRLTTREQLSKLRVKKDEMLRRWDEDEDGWRDLPARAWPAKQPNPEQLEGIVAEIKSLSCNDIIVIDNNNNNNNNSNADDNNNYRSNNKKKIDDNNEVLHCTDLLFDMATTLVFYNVNPEAGLELYERLARRGHVDSMVACGIILVEGLGVPPQEREGFVWLEKAIEAGSSAQACYELGTIYYTGIDGFIEEDSEKAYKLFERAAQQDHTAALYMTADCLVEGEGVERSVAKAIPLFYKAADRGHRFSRQRIRELLARRDYPL
jgi:hypothetical protein